MTKKREITEETLKVVGGAETVVEAIPVEWEDEAKQYFETHPLKPIADVVGQPEPEAEPTINWLDRHARTAVRREIPLSQMEGWVVGEEIGSPYYLIRGGKRRMLFSVAQAMGFGAVEFLRAEELAKIPEGAPCL